MTPGTIERMAGDLVAIHHWTPATLWGMDAVDIGFAWQATDCYNREQNKAMEEALPDG